MQSILKLPGFTDNVVTHLLAGLGAGFFAVCIGSPVDVVKFQYLLDLDFLNILLPRNLFVLQFDMNFSLFFFLF